MPYQIIKPAYYDKFQCLGGDCKLTCCQDWKIFISKSDYTKIKNARKPKELAEEVAKSVKRIKPNGTNEHYAQIEYNEQNYCAMMNKNGLCQLQMECGYTTLPTVCKIFPRIKNILRFDINSALIEASSTFGCEEIVNMMMKLENGIEFVSETANHDAIPFYPKSYNKIHIEKRPTLKYLVDIQTLGIAILQNRFYTLNQRMLLLGLALKHISDLETDGNSDQIPSYVDEFLSQPNDTSILDIFSDIKPNYNLLISNSVAIICVIEGNASFKALTHTVLKNLSVEFTDTGYNFNSLPYINAVEARNEFFKNREYILENIIVNYFFMQFQPFASYKHTIWQNYMSFCSLYSLFNFYITGVLCDNPNDETFVNAVTVFSRKLTHNETFKSVFCDRLDKNDSNTLAHMAILINS